MKQMKKVFILALIFLLCGVNVMAKRKSPVSVTSGSLDFIKKGGTAAVVFDYSDLSVNRIPLDDFLASRNVKFNNDWKWVIVPDTEDFFVNYCTKYLNESNFIVSENDSASVDYKLVLHLISLDLGSPNRWTSTHVYTLYDMMRIGGAVISGSLDCIDSQTGETLCEVTFDKVQGVSAYSDRDRWRFAYEDFVKYLKKLSK